MLNLVDTIPSQLKALKYTPLETLVTSVARKLESVCSSGGPVDWPNRTTTVAMVHADDTSRKWQEEYRAAATLQQTHC